MCPLAHAQHLVHKSTLYTKGLLTYPGGQLRLVPHNRSLAWLGCFAEVEESDTAKQELCMPMGGFIGILTTSAAVQQHSGACSHIVDCLVSPSQVPAMQTVLSVVESACR